MTKVVKLPVLIPDEDKELRLLKYKALDKVMQEAQFLGNLAIRYAIALTLKGISRELDPARESPSRWTLKSTGSWPREEHISMRPPSPHWEETSH
jgi:hypothetical protein